MILLISAQDATEQLSKHRQPNTDRQASCYNQFRADLLEPTALKPILLPVGVGILIGSRDG